MRKFTYLVMCLLMTNLLAQPTHYLVFDAGSSGTRMSFFEVKSAANSQQLPEIIQLLGKGVNGRELRVQPGIAAFVGHEKDLWPNLRTLFNQAQAYLVKHGIKPADVEVYFYATAGMRLVDDKKQADLFQLIRDKIKSSTPFQNIAHVGIISGEQEGYFDWLAVNYDNLIDGSPTSMVMDLGGASMQVSVELGHDPDHYRLPYKTYDILGHPRHVSSVSFLGFGLELVLSRVSNYWQQSYNVCLPERYTADYIDNPENVDFSYEACRGVFSHYIRSRGEYNANFKHLFRLINDHPNMPITGLDNFYFVMSFFNADNPVALAKSIENSCPGDAERSVTFSPEHYSKERECPKGVYLLTLYDFLGFASNNEPMLFYMDNWAKGAVAQAIFEKKLDK